MAGDPTTVPVAIYLEAGRSRIFACAIDWPGWCRRAKTAPAALDALVEYLPRYAKVTARAGVRFVPKGGRPEFGVVQTLPAPEEGFSPADFGTLGRACDSDADPLNAAQARRLAALVEAAWAEFDAVVATAPPQLRKGPRGGGRDRDKIVEHVLGAEAAYARKIGVRVRQPALGDGRAIEQMRAEILTTVRAARAQPVADKQWLPRYAARRIAWHLLDHAWEIEDRSRPDGR